MKLKGRRQSKNVIDKRDEILGDSDWDQLSKEGYVDKTLPRPPRPSKEFLDAMRENRITKKLNRLEQQGRTPTPTPKPSRIQVTPGLWLTKNIK